MSNPFVPQYVEMRTFTSACGTEVVTESRNRKYCDNCQRVAQANSRRMSKLRQRAKARGIPLAELIARDKIKGTGR